MRGMDPSKDKATISKRAKGVNLAKSRALKKIRGEEVNEAAPKPLNRSNHTHTVHIDGEGQYKVKARSMDHAKKIAFKQAGISKLHGHPTMEPKTRIYGEEIEEKTLTPAEKKKREEVAKAIERENPNMPMDQKMAIATATAKKVAESDQSDRMSSPLKKARLDK